MNIKSRMDHPYDYFLGIILLNAQVNRYEEIISAYHHPSSLSYQKVLLSPIPLQSHPNPIRIQDRIIRDSPNQTGAGQLTAIVYISLVDIRTQEALVYIYIPLGNLT
jgi:hypothetical protein